MIRWYNAGRLEAECAAWLAPYERWADCLSEAFAALDIRIVGALPERAPFGDSWPETLLMSYCIVVSGRPDLGRLPGPLGPDFPDAYPFVDL